MAENHDELHGYDFEGFLSPGDGEVARAITRRTARGLFAGMCLAGFVMAALLSKLFLQEVRGLPPGEIEDSIVEYADRWHRQMSGLKLDLLVAGVRGQVEDWQDITWNDVGCAINILVPSGPELDGQTDSAAPESGCPEQD